MVVIIWGIGGGVGDVIMGMRFGKGGMGLLDWCEKRRCFGSFCLKW